MLEAGRAGRASPGAPSQARARVGDDRPALGARPDVRRADLRRSRVRRRYGEEDLAQAEDVARRAALAIDNARLHSDAQQARRDAELAASVSGRLHAVTASLARRRPRGRGRRVAVGEGSRPLDADAAAALFLHEPQRGRFVALAHTGYPAEMRPRTRRSRSRSTIP